MLRLACSLVPSRAVAEEVVQDAWVRVLRGISRFEGRSSVRTWLFRILVNRARTTGTRERRSTAIGDAGPAVEQSRFGLDGQWISPPEHWIEESDDRLTAAKMADRIRSALDALPARQREVVTLRDVEGLSSEEVCTVLEILRSTSGSCCTAAAAGYARFSRQNSGGPDHAAEDQAPRPGHRVPAGRRAGDRIPASRRIWPTAGTAPSTSRRCARPSS